MNYLERAVLDGLIKKLNAYILKVSIDKNIPKEKICIVYWKDNLFYQLPDSKPVLINTEEL